MDLTIAAVPFSQEKDNLTAIHQLNALTSWALLTPKPHILLLGDEPGMADLASSLDIDHVPDIAKNKLGDLSMASIFDQIRTHAGTEWVAYLDADVILLDDFLPTIAYCTRWWDNCLACAFRYDANLPNPIDFQDPLWQDHVRSAIYKQGRRGSDWFVYRLGTYSHIPDFSIGGGHWDGWAIASALHRDIPVIDTTKACQAVHQKHPLRWKKHRGEDRNKRLAGQMAWVSDATNYVNKKDVQKS